MNSSKDKEEKLNTVIAGMPEEFEETRLLLKDAGIQHRVLGRLSVTEKEEAVIGYWKKLKVLSITFPFGEVVFCQGKITFKEILEVLPQLPKTVTAKFMQAEAAVLLAAIQKIVPAKRSQKRMDINWPIHIIAV